MFLTTFNIHLMNAEARGAESCGCDKTQFELGE